MLDQCNVGINCNPDEIKCIGSGFNGSVYTLNDNFVLKVGEEDNDTFYDSINTLKQVPGVVKIQNVVNYDGKRYEIMERCECTLKDRINSGFYSNNPRMLSNHFLQIVKIISDLHKKRIAHLDLKPSNIMFDKDDNVKIIDFGSMLLCNDGKSSAQRGTFRNYSFDVANGLVKGTGYDPFKYDIWCLGLVLYKMVFIDEMEGFGRYSLNNLTNLVASLGNKKRYLGKILKVRGVFNAEYDKNIRGMSTSELKNLLTSMLAKYDKNRPSLDEIIKTLQRIENQC